MKIYCTRALHSKTDEDVFDDLVGKDVWVRFEGKTCGGATIFFWLQFLEKGYYSLFEPWYRVNSADEKLGDSTALTWKRNNIYYDLSDLQDKLIRPLEILSTEELFTTKRVL